MLLFGSLGGTFLGECQQKFLLLVSWGALGMAATRHSVRQLVAIQMRLGAHFHAASRGGVLVV